MTMLEQDTAFQVGDQVIHWIYGIGEIIQMDEKILLGKTGKYYVVQMRDLTLWVPRNKTGSQCLRAPTAAEDFEELFQILSSPGEPLSTNSYARKTELTEILKDKTLESICRVVRDLVSYKRSGRINENDNSTLAYARNFLLNEWSVALSVPFQQAERELADLLETNLS
jgi:RNA polymerase-interacting CarD/CdnL/TRCF family regulator